MRGYDSAAFTDEEILIFVDCVRTGQKGPLNSNKRYYTCIAYALSRIGEKRRKPRCGFYVDKIKEGLAKTIQYELTEEEMQKIVSYCMDESLENTVNNAREHCGEVLIRKLERRVPIFVSRTRRLIDYLDD